MIEMALACLALNVYFESRDQDIAGQVAVAQVTMNRVASPEYPNNVCDVVYQNKYNNDLHRCQFSWYCDGKSDHPTNRKAWLQAQSVASGVLAGSGHMNMDNVLHYHSVKVNPWWNRKMTIRAQIKDHIFYESD